MKEYNVKYKVGADVYILSSKKIYKSRIDKIRVIESQPYSEFEYGRHPGEKGSVVEKDGIEIDYLVITYKTDNYTSYDWYSQDDIFDNEEELIRKIK